MMLKRDITNRVRYVLDNWLPPVIRDNKYVMYPLQWIFFRGKDVNRMRELKSYFHTLSEDEYIQYYKDLDMITKRPTDMNQASIDFILACVNEYKDAKIIDIGCGRGYFLERLRELGCTDLHGCDLFETFEMEGVDYTQANVEDLPFADNSFDIVICSHVLEHVLHVQKTVDELKRIARKKVIVTVPMQRYYHYTFDPHISFFPEPSYLIHTMGMNTYRCEIQQGDLVFVGEKNA